MMFRRGSLELIAVGSLAAAFLTTTIPAGATGSVPSVSRFKATPTSLDSNGGTVTLSASVTNAKSCHFKSTEPVAGLPATVTCTSGRVRQTVTLPANSETTAVKWTFKLVVKGSEKVHANPLTVTESASASHALTGVQSLASSGGVVSSASKSNDGVHTMAAVTSGGDSYCAVLSTGGVDCWGDNTFGQLGNGAMGGPDDCYGVQECYDAPQAVVGMTDASSLASEGDGYCAVLSTGGVDCWGDNIYGELGNGTINGPEDCDYLDTCYDTPQAVTDITNAVSVTSDGVGYCSVLSVGGVDCWGDNSWGEIGNGTMGGPDQTGYDTPQAVAGINQAVSISSDGGSNYNSYCAVLSTGGVDCWGDNTHGELGNGTMGGPDGVGGYDDDTPQAVAGIADAISVSSDGGVNYDSYCAVLSTGGVDCWGDNTDGQLGNGTVGGPDIDSFQSQYSGYDSPQPVSGVTGATSVASDQYGACAVLSTGGVDCWGDNTFGELGDGSVGGPDVLGFSDEYSGYDTPQPVSDMTDATSVASDAYDDGYCAVLSSGDADCWGINEAGEIGNGTVGGPDALGPDDAYSGYDTPQTVSGVADVASVASDGNIYCAVLTSSEADCWGANGDGNLGNGTIGGPDGIEGYDTPQFVISE